MDIEKEILLEEYKQAASDWRHRDAMLWQTLSLVVAITGAAFAYVFGKDVDILGKVIVLFFTTVLTLLSFIKITKDHWYQRGSAAYSKHLIQRLHGKNLHEILGVADEDFVTPRQYSKMGSSNHLLYKKVIRVSAFSTFYYVSMCLFTIVAICFIYFFVALINIPCK